MRFLIEGLSTGDPETFTGKAVVRSFGLNDRGIMYVDIDWVEEEEKINTLSIIERTFIGAKVLVVVKDDKVTIKSIEPPKTIEHDNKNMTIQQKWFFEWLNMTEDSNLAAVYLSLWL